MMKPTKLTILQINDTHGYLEPHPELFWQGDKVEYRTSGGYARLLTIFKRMRHEQNGAVIERGGVRGGIIGIAATILDKTMPPQFIEGLRFTLGNQELPGHIRTLREQERVDLVVVLSHLGFSAGCETRSRSRRHRHFLEWPHAQPDGSTPRGERRDDHSIGLSRIVFRSFDVELDGRKFIPHQLIHVDDSIPADPEMERLIEDIMSPHRQVLAEVVGQTETDLNRNTFLESTMDNLCPHFG